MAESRRAPHIAPHRPGKGTSFGCDRRRANGENPTEVKSYERRAWDSNPQPRSRGTSFPVRPLAIRLPSGFGTLIFPYRHLSRESARIRGNQCLSAIGGASAACSVVLPAAACELPRCGLRCPTMVTAALTHPTLVVGHLGAANKLDELLVGVELGQLRGQLLHGVDVVHRSERAPEHRQGSSVLVPV